MTDTAWLVITLISIASVGSFLLMLAMSIRNELHVHDRRVEVAERCRAFAHQLATLYHIDIETGEPLPPPGEVAAILLDDDGNEVVQATEDAPAEEREIEEPALQAA